MQLFAVLILLAFYTTAAQSAEADKTTKLDNHSSLHKLSTLLRLPIGVETRRKKRQCCGGYSYGGCGSCNSGAFACGGQPALAGCINGACGGGLVCVSGFCCNSNLGLGTSGLYGNALYPNTGVVGGGLPLYPNTGVVGGGVYGNGLYGNGFTNNGLYGNGLTNNGLYGNGIYGNGLTGNGLYGNGLYGDPRLIGTTGVGVGQIQGGFGQTGLGVGTGLNTGLNTGLGIGTAACTGGQLACVNFSCGQGFTCTANCCVPGFNNYG